MQQQTTYHWGPDTVANYLPLRTRYSDKPLTIEDRIYGQTTYRYSDEQLTIEDQMVGAIYYWGPDRVSNHLPLRTRYSGKPLTIQNQMVGAIFLHHWHWRFLLCGRLCILEGQLSHLCQNKKNNSKCSRQKLNVIGIKCFNQLILSRKHHLH